MNEVRQAIEELGIPFLVHFTRTTNLRSIMQKGILPRSAFEAEGVAADINDELRLDGELGAVSLSVGFPNSKMLWKLRQENPGVNWAVLVIAREVLWDLPCAFCKHNAADSRISCLPTESLQSVDALKSMYGEVEGLDRSGDRLKGFDPTDVQAEILAFGTIQPNSILGAAFQRGAIRSQYEPLFPGRKVVLHGDRGFFSDRGYHRRNTP
jgi:hypothetical protein